MLITRRLKEAATVAFRDNSRLVEMSLDDRESAAQQYEQLAAQMVGVQAELARRYNLERAKFLRGQVSRLAPSAPDFAAGIGYSHPDEV